MFKFLADSPTVTMQRLKGMTTGSLPTFIDIRNNFAASSVAEDSLIAQLVAHNRSIGFVGDDTWLALYPNHFNQSYPYDSFNVKDLDTVDEGVAEHFIPLLERAQHSLLIGHCLGVDHKRLTYRFQGRDFRLTDVHGNVIHDILV